MTTLMAMLLVIIVVGMLLSYYVGYSIGRKEGFESGHAAGKKEGSVRAFAVGYDRGRHDRQTKQQADEEEKAKSSDTTRGCAYWLLPLLIAGLLAIVSATVLLRDKLAL